MALEITAEKKAKPAVAKPAQPIKKLSEMSIDELKALPRRKLILVQHQYGRGQARFSANLKLSDHLDVQIRLTQATFFLICKLRGKSISYQEVDPLTVVVRISKGQIKSQDSEDAREYYLWEMLPCPGANRKIYLHGFLTPDSVLLLQAENLEQDLQVVDRGVSSEPLSEEEDLFQDKSEGK